MWLVDFDRVAIFQGMEDIFSRSSLKEAAQNWVKVSVFLLISAVSVGRLFFLIVRLIMRFIK